MDYRRALPFYHAYPQYDDLNLMDAASLAEDLAYLQQMYPAYAKKYQVRISRLLDTMDYEGSMIYDQYPDRWQLERFVESVMKVLKDEEPDTDSAQWQWIRELVTVLVYYEILKRRNKKKNYYIF